MIGNSSWGDYPDASLNTYDDADWRILDLPHDWSIEGTLDPENPMGNDGGYFPAGMGWYRKSFEIPSKHKGKKVGIYFEGVYMNSEVFINGKSVGIRPYGYSSFYYDLTPYLRYDDKNIIAVRVDNSQRKLSLVHRYRYLSACVADSDECCSYRALGDSYNYS